MSGEVASGAYSALIIGACGHQWYVGATAPLDAEQRTIEKAKGCPDCSDLQRRITRTVEYVVQLEHGPLAHETRMVLDAIWRSLTTPSRSRDSGASS